MICADAFCLEPNQNQLRDLRREDQFQATVRDFLYGEDHPSNFWLIELGPWEKQKLYWVDCRTWQVYDPQTKYCMSGQYMKLKDHPVEAKKKLRSVMRNHKTKYIEETI